MNPNVVRAVAVVHQSGLDLPVAAKRGISTDEPWRLKNWEGHPLDPGWEDGIYCLCHKRFRNSRQRASGEIVVDCVNPDGASKEGYIVRSFFEITGGPVECPFKGSGQDLLFNSYFFADREPYRLHCGTIGHNWKALTASSLAELLDHPSYNRYRVSFNKGPLSIAGRDWELMSRIKRQRKVEWLKAGNSCCR